MENSQMEQMKVNGRIASKLKIEQKEAFSIGTNVQRRLLKPVNENIFIMLCKLFHNVGEEYFKNSLALQMANSGHNKKQIHSIVRSTILNIKYKG